MVGFAIYLLYSVAGGSAAAGLSQDWRALPCVLCYRIPLFQQLSWAAVFALRVGALCGALSWTGSTGYMEPQARWHRYQFDLSIQGGLLVVGRDANGTEASAYRSECVANLNC